LNEPDLAEVPHNFSSLEVVWYCEKEATAGHQSKLKEKTLNASIFGIFLSQIYNFFKHGIGVGLEYA
jgi:hypothetical protein